MIYKIDYKAFAREYAELRKQGMGHWQALRTLAEKYGKRGED